MSVLYAYFNHNKKVINSTTLEKYYVTFLVWGKSKKAE